MQPDQVTTFVRTHIIIYFQSIGRKRIADPEVTGMLINISRKRIIQTISG